MTSSEDRCSLSAFFPMSCPNRAEEFARNLRSRLRLLTSHDEDKSSSENNWLCQPQSSVTVLQPLQTDSTIYFDLGDCNFPLESPEEETEGREMDNAMNENINVSLNSNHQYSSEQTTVGVMNSTNKVENISYNFNNRPESTLKSFQESLSNTCLTSSLSNSQKTMNAVPDNNFCSRSNSEPLLTSQQMDVNKCEELNQLKSDTEYNLHKNSNTNGWALLYCLNNENEFIKTCKDDEVEEAIPRVRRCSSLKTGKSPPGTPGEKKIVRFADVLGLDLADVRTFLDEIPKIPNSAYDDLKDANLNETAVKIFHNIKHDKVLIPLFQQPGGQPDFIDRINKSQVCLDNALVDDPVNLSIVGTVRVKNLDFHKSVHIRYTLDSWHNFSDLQATYVENSCDGYSDKFSFTLFANTLLIGQKLEFAVRFQCRGCQYWDNNKGKNYCFHCLPADNTVSSPLTENENSFDSSLYY